ncbi:MAG TPA: COX aromatic rich motif-containing protein, partial [Pararhizobium sp.]|nr:COX aromatic rich motif-containing protein [Pararhizobium sp.]
PSRDVPVIYYKSVDANLFNSILDLCGMNAPACASGGVQSSAEQVPTPKQNGPKTFQSLTPQTRPAGQ